MIKLTTALLKKHDEVVVGTYRRTLSTGLSVLNWALSGSCSHGIQSGDVLWMSGTSDSGRTIAGLTLLAEAANNLEFDKYRLCYADTENKQVDIARLFGKKLASRLYHDTGDTTTDFWERVFSIMQPTIYVLDSIDGLQGTWQENNQNAKAAFDHIYATDSILIILSQQKTVDDKKVAAGGSAIPFYADYIIHTERVTTTRAEHCGKLRHTGILSNFSVIKRKTEGKIKKVPVLIFADYGFDNAETTLQFLRDSGRVVFRKGHLYFTDFLWEESEEGMVNLFRENQKLVDFYIERMLK